MSDDGEFIAALEASAVDASIPPEAISHFTIGEAKLILGATDGWWELLCAIGIIGFPVGVLGNLLASWIWSAIPQSGSTSRESRVIKLILRNGSRVSELRVESKDRESLQAAIEAALIYVDSER